MTRWPETEAQLGAVVEPWLIERGWSVWREVEVVTGEWIADQVIQHAQKGWGVVEVKKNLGLRVMQQADRWREHADLVCVAVPAPANRERDEARQFACRLCRMLGIGVIEVDGRGEGAPTLTDRVTPKALRPDPTKRRQLIEAVRPEHNEGGPAGAPSGGHWTKFRATIENLARYAKAHPDCTLKEAVPSIEHHYADDKAAINQLGRLARRGELSGKSGLRYRMDAGLMRWRVETEGAAT